MNPVMTRGTNGIASIDAITKCQIVHVQTKDLIFVKTCQVKQFISICHKCSPESCKLIKGSAITVRFEQEDVEFCKDQYKCNTLDYPVYLVNRYYHSHLREIY